MRIGVGAGQRGLKTAIVACCKDVVDEKEECCRLGQILAFKLPLS